MAVERNGMDEIKSIVIVVQLTRLKLNLAILNDVPWPIRQKSALSTSPIQHRVNATLLRCSLGIGCGCVGLEAKAR